MLVGVASRCSRVDASRPARARRPTLTEQVVRRSSVTRFVFSGSIISRARADHLPRAGILTFTWRNVLSPESTAHGLPVRTGLPRAGARPSARSEGRLVRISSRSGSTGRSAMRVRSGSWSGSGRRVENRSRIRRACRATDRSIEIEVVQDPGGRRERPRGSREPPERSGRTTPHLRHVPGGAFHVSPSELR